MSKGSGRRQNRDDKAYSDNWDRIFGNAQKSIDRANEELLKPAPAWQQKIAGVLHPVDNKPIKSIEPTPRCAEPFCSCEEGVCQIFTRGELA